MIERRTAVSAVIQERRCRATGAIVSVIDAERSADFETAEGGRWVTYCETHETFCQHETRALAVHHAADSGTWCGLCAEGMD
jgi:hypothetical protein